MKAFLCTLYADAEVCRQSALHVCGHKGPRFSRTDAKKINVPMPCWLKHQTEGKLEARRRSITRTEYIETTKPHFKNSWSKSYNSFQMQTGAPHVALYTHVNSRVLHALEPIRIPGSRCGLGRDCLRRILRSLELRHQIWRPTTRTQNR